MGVCLFKVWIVHAHVWILKGDYKTEGGRKLELINLEAGRVPPAGNKNTWTPHIPSAWPTIPLRAAYTNTSSLE